MRLYGRRTCLDDFTAHALAARIFVLFFIGESLSESYTYVMCCGILCLYLYIHLRIYSVYFNKMKKEVGMLLQKRAGTRAVGIYKLYEENTH